MTFLVLTRLSPFSSVVLGMSSTAASSSTDEAQSASSAASTLVRPRGKSKVATDTVTSAASPIPIVCSALSSSSSSSLADARCSTAAAPAATTQVPVIEWVLASTENWPTERGNDDHAAFDAFAATRANYAHLCVALDADDATALALVKDEEATQCIQQFWQALGVESLLSAILQGRRRAAAWLIAHGALLGVRQIYAESELGRALEFLNVGRYSTTPLHVAALVGDVETGAALIAAGANVEEKDSMGATPLFVAFTTRFANMLNEAGARRDIVSSRGFSVLNEMFHFDAHDVVRILLQGKQAADVNLVAWGFSVLHLCAIRGAEKCTQLLIDAGARVELVDVAGRTALDLALFHGRWRLIATLLKAEAKARAVEPEAIATPALFRFIRATERPSFAPPPSFIAVDEDNARSWCEAPSWVACMQALWKAGAPLNACDSSGYTVLDRVLLNPSENNALITALLEAGADYQHWVLFKERHVSPFGLALTNPTTPELVDAFLALPDITPNAVVTRETGQTAWMRGIVADRTDKGDIVNRLLASGAQISDTFKEESKLSSWREWVTSYDDACADERERAAQLDNASFFNAVAQTACSERDKLATETLNLFLPAVLVGLVTTFTGQMRGTRFDLSCPHGLVS